MTDRFDVCLPYTLAQECPFPRDWSNPKNYSNDKHDPGGETQCGITQREYDTSRKVRLLVCQDVRLCTQTEGEAIYRGYYWLPYCPNMPPGLDMSFFDASVNMGTTESVRILQHILGIQSDGIYGPHTVTRVGSIQARDVPAIVRTFTVRRHQVYQMMNGFKYFGDDWTRRTNEIGIVAEKMTTGNI